MKVKLKRDFTCHPPDTPGQKVTFKKGDEVEGKVAEWAVAHGAADARTAPKKSVDSKSLKEVSTKSFEAAPENK